MILIVCLNLAIDQTIQIDQLEIGQIHRSRSTRLEAGSKGVNVARVLKTLEMPCLLTGFLGGPAGQFIAASLAREKITCSPCLIQNESRSCYILVESRISRQTVVNEPGPEIRPEELEHFITHFDGLLADSEWVLFSGSLPPGVPDTTYGQLISRARASGRRALLDSSGAGLGCALAAGPNVLKVNRSEAAALLECSIQNPNDAVEAAERLCKGSTALVMITLGEEGAVLVTSQERYVLAAPRIEAKNSVGSGDAALAGLAAGLACGVPAEQAGVLAVAAGAANALHGGGHCTLEEIVELHARVHCTRIVPGR
jgi:1-phosphofructokinase family hexose kinase